MIGRARRSGGAIPMWRKICSTLRRTSASNSGAFSVVNSSPYHQHQSLPSAASAASYAFSKRSGGSSGRVRSRMARACPSIVQAWLSSEWPIQMRKFESIQLPEWMREIRAAGGTRRDLLPGQHRDDVVAETTVERVQEALAGARIVLPRVLAIERHGDRGLLVRRCEAREEVLGGAGRVALAVPEADAVAQGAIAREHRHVAAHPGRMAQRHRRGLLQLAALPLALIRRAPAPACGGEGLHPGGP